MNNKITIIFIIIFIIIAALLSRNTQPDPSNNSSAFIEADYSNSEYEIIYFAGGCFWGVQTYFDRILGVIYTDVGYINGKNNDTSYFFLKDTEHAEAVQVVYDPKKVELEDLVKYFYDVIDPTELNKQGADEGIQYRSGIYYTNTDDLEIIESVTEQEQTKYSEKIVTEIEALKNYVVAEVEHQHYLIKNPSGYCHINLNIIPNEKPEIRPADYIGFRSENLRNTLSAIEYLVTQQNGTEYAFDNDYWDNENKGIYVDVVSGEPLFLSIDKYASGSGWPSFTKPISSEVLTYHYDNELEYQRIEVRSRVADSHLGHVFSDGKSSESSLRYCINSAALNFIPFEQMDKDSYEKFKVYFE
ncbi:MAG: peptide-methionine (R)-S-oxide reductase MsrB [Clostridia bacterium]